MAAGTTKTKLLFIGHLNRLHCAKAHLTERLVDICDEPIFANVKAAIEEALAHTEEQIANLDRIYSLLGTKYSFEDCADLVASLEETFSAIQANIRDPETANILVLAYLHRIVYIENAEKEVMLLLAGKMHNNELVAMIKQPAGDGQNTLITKLTALYKGAAQGLKFLLFLVGLALELV